MRRVLRYITFSQTFVSVYLVFWKRKFTFAMCQQSVRKFGPQFLQIETRSVQKVWQVL